MVNVLAFEQRERPPAPEWRSDDSVPTYFEILIDGLPLARHLLDAARTNGIEEEPTEHGPALIVRQAGRVERLSFYNYLPPLGWGSPEWETRWVSWALSEEASPFSTEACRYWSAAFVGSVRRLWHGSQAPAVLFVGGICKSCPGRKAYAVALDPLGPRGG